MLNTENSNLGDIAEQVGAVASRLGSPCTVILKNPMNHDQIAALMALVSVDSVILGSPDESISRCYPGRVGWYDFSQSKFIYPLRTSKELVYVGCLSALGFRVISHAWVAGGRVLHLVDPTDGHSQYRILGVLVRTALSSMRFRLAKTRAGPIIAFFLSYVLVRQGISGVRELRLGEYIPVPKRVVVVVGSLGAGGSERQAVNTLIGLRDRGIKNVVLLHEKPLQPPHDFFLAELRASGVACQQLSALQTEDYRKLSLLRVGRFRKLLRILGVSEGEALAYLIKFQQERPEVVHTWLDAINVTAGLVAAIVGVPRVVIGCRSLAPYHFAFHQPYMKVLYRFLATFSNVIILNNSKAGANDYEAWLGLSRGVIRVLPNGFDFKHIATREDVGSKTLSYLRQFGIPANAKIVGTVMRLTEEKNPFLWIGMAELVCREHKDVYFLIVGDGPLRCALEAEVARIGLVSRVVFAGPRKDLYQFLALIDVFVLTSRVEGLPNVIIEAQSLGIPVVATAVGGVEETFENGDTGFSIQKQTPAAVAEKVSMLLASNDIRMRIRARAPAMIRERFSIGRMIDETLDVYGFNRRSH